MKRRPFIALLLSLVLVLGWTLSACEDTPLPYDPASDNGEALESAKNAALEDLNALMTTTEEVYSVTLWSWEYSCAFAEKPSADRLLKAMAALSAAERALDEIRLPRMTLSQNQFQLLDSMGISLGNLTEACSTLDMTVSNAQLIVQNLRINLEQDIHNQVVLEALPQYCAQMRQMMELDCAFMGYLANDVLLVLDRKDEWKRMKDDYPCMVQWFDDWYDSGDTLLKLADENLAQAIALDNQTEAFVGVMEYTLEVLNEADQTGDYSRLSGLLEPAVSKIDYFPIPDFVENDVRWIYMKGDAGSMSVIAPLETISDVPTGCYTTLTGVRRSDVETYAGQVDQVGMRSSANWDEENQCYTLTVASGSSYFLIQWTEQETVLYLSEPVGAFMMPLYYILLCME